MLCQVEISGQKATENSTNPFSFIYMKSKNRTNNHTKVDPNASKYLAGPSFFIKNNLEILYATRIISQT